MRPPPTPTSTRASARRRARTARAPARLSAAIGLATLLAANAAAQRVPERTVPHPIDFATSQDDNLFSLLRSQDNIHAWEVALGEIEVGDYKAAVERLHRLLQTEVGGVVPVAPGRFLGLRLAVVTTMANLPPAGTTAYEDLVHREAGNLADCNPADLEADQLLRLAERFPTAAIGRRARLRLGDLALEAGHGTLAASHYREALDATPIGSAAERAVVERLQAAAVLADPVTARARAADKNLPQAGGDVLETLPASGDPTRYAAIGGGHDGRTPMAAPAGRPAPKWAEEVSAPGFTTERDIGQFAMFPVGDLDGIYVNTGREVIAFDPLRHSVAWVSASPMREVESDPGADDYRDRRGRRSDTPINNDMVLAASCSDDIVVAALQVPEKSVNVDFQASFRIISKIPQRRLFAFSRSTGKLVWSHFDEMDGPCTRRFRGHDSCAPPLVVGDTVYAPIHDRSGAIAFAIAAYDLHTGLPKWRRLVCSSQQDVNMFGNARMEFAASPLSIAGGVIHGASNLGVAYALDAGTGRIRWVTSYEVVSMPHTMLHGQADRSVYFANNVPVVADGVACCTPLDSPYVLGFDAENGRLLWQLTRDAPIDGIENRLLWLAGALGDEFILTGNGAVAVKARPQGLRALEPSVRQLVRPEQLRDRSDGRLPPRPAVTADRVWFARSGRLLAFYGDGNPTPREQQIVAQGYEPGNLLLVDGIIVSLRERAFVVLDDAAALVQRVEERLAANPDDPAAILRLACLRAALLPEGASPAAAAEVQALYRRGLDACVRRGLPRTHAVRQALQRQFYEQALATAHAALQRREARAIDLFVEARDAAPDVRTWIEVQALVLRLCAGDDARTRAELAVLEREAGDERFPVGERGTGAGIPVPTYVLWRRALLAEGQPAAAVGLWQDLLEHHGDVRLEDGTAAQVAQANIARLLAAHGEGIYAKIAARADAALAAAGDDPEALHTISAHFPNSAAAATASVRLLDRSVRDGDLASACRVLGAGPGSTSGEVAPGILRRVLVAAVRRGNRGLARAMAARLQAFASQRSDWPEDKGASYAEVLRALAPQLEDAAARVRVAVPRDEIVRIPLRSPRDSFRLLPVLIADGFDVAPDTPLFVASANELLAFDVHAPAGRAQLFAIPVGFLEHVVLCGTTLVVPDMERLFAVDYRTGTVSWEMETPKSRWLDGLAVQHGVLHVSAQSNSPDGSSDFLGIEPLTGSILFERKLPGDVLKPVPRSIEGQLLVMESQTDGSASVHRIDPVSGATLRTVHIDASVLQAQLQPDSLGTRLYAQGVCADADRVFLPVDSMMAGDTPRLVAIDNAGNVIWQWQGRAGNHLVMAAVRGAHVVVAEGSESKPGRIQLLAARDGAVQRSIDLGPDVTILNWEHSWLPNGAPAAVVLSDLADVASRQHRVVCFAVDPDLPTFEFPLANEDGDVERQPQFGDDFVTFGVRPAKGSSTYRLYSVHLGDRSGTLPGGAKYKRLGLGSTYGLTAVGTYTVISSSLGLLVLGSDQGK